MSGLPVWSSPPLAMLLNQFSQRAAASAGHVDWKKRRERKIEKQV